MTTIKKYLDRILIALGVLVILIGTALLGSNLGNTYSAVERLHTDSSALDRLENAGQVTDISLLIMVVGAVILAAGIALLVRRLVRS